MNGSWNCDQVKLVFRYIVVNSLAYFNQRVEFQKKDKSFVMSEKRHYWCKSTNSNSKVTEFTWTIEDFENRPQKTGDFLYSSSFVIKLPNDKETYWQMKLFPKGEKPGDRDYLSLFLQSNNNCAMSFQYEMSILDSSAKKTSTWKCRGDSGRLWGNPKWALRDSIINDPDLLPGGNLTIFCVVTAFGTAQILSGTRDGEAEDEIESGSNIARGLKQVSEDFGKLFNDKEFSDVEIECGGEIFHCHTSILSIRSDVFRAMFQSDMAENRSKKVIIKDIDSEVAKEMLHFIYTGGTNEDVLKDNAGKLLEVAERYHLDVLKSICEDHLCSNLKISDAIENLIFGDFHQAKKLKRKALKVIARNLTKVVQTDEYQNLFKHHPALAAEIPMAIVEMT